MADSRLNLDPLKIFLVMYYLSNVDLSLPQSEIGLWEHLTKSRPILHPIKEAKAAAITVRPWMLDVYLYSMFMVMLTLYHSVLTRSYQRNLGQWAALSVPFSWEGELRTAATLIPASLRGSLLPVEHSERRVS